MVGFVLELLPAFVDEVTSLVASCFFVDIVTCVAGAVVEDVVSDVVSDASNDDGARVEIGIGDSTGETFVALVVEIDDGDAVTELVSTTEIGFNVEDFVMNINEDKKAEVDAIGIVEAVDDFTVGEVTRTALEVCMFGGLDVGVNI